eukprot:COSAG06_NODE_8502_length_2147_cov_2.647949_1_plen_217_part_00
MLPLVSEGWQLYTTQQLGVWPHYISSSGDLTQKLDVARASGLTAAIHVVADEDLIHPTWAELPFNESDVSNIVSCFENGLGKWDLMRGTVVRSRGYSGQNQKGGGRLSGERPYLTTSQMPDDLFALISPVISYFTEVAASAGLRPRCVGMFNELVPGTDTYHEAVAVVVTRRHFDLDVHVDPENDWWPGHNTMHALSFTGNDAKGQFRLAFFGYPW